MSLLGPHLVFCPLTRQKAKLWRQLVPPGCSSAGPGTHVLSDSSRGHLEPDVVLKRLCLVLVLPHAAAICSNQWTAYSASFSFFDFSLCKGRGWAVCDPFPLLWRDWWEEQMQDHKSTMDVWFLQQLLHQPCLDTLSHSTLHLHKHPRAAVVESCIWGSKSLACRPRCPQWHHTVEVNLGEGWAQDPHLPLSVIQHRPAAV